MVLVFMVAEKPMLAQSIASLLSDKHSVSRKGWNGACSVHEYDGQFRGQPCRFKMTSTCGHVMGLDFPAKFNDWEKIDPTRLFDVPVRTYPVPTYLPTYLVTYLPTYLFIYLHFAR